MIGQLFDEVLSELDSSGADSFGSEWQSKVIAGADALSSYYGNHNLLDPNRALVDYGGLPTQAAYIFMYAVGRAHFTYQLLCRFRKEIGRPIFGKTTLNVTSVGGGPASELVGLIFYLDDLTNGESVSEILYDVIDKEGDWESVTDLVVEKLATSIDITTRCIQCDLSVSGASTNISLEFDDLVMMSFFVSEICELPNAKAVRDNIESLCHSMRKGAKLFYNDSDAYSFYYYMNQRARSVKGLVELAEIQDTISFDYSDPGETFQEYEEFLGKVPHLSSKAVSKLYDRSLT